jgi:hypothetical protein
MFMLYINYYNRCHGNAVNGFSALLDTVCDYMYVG